MGTQASIAVKQGESYSAITVNFDGYLDHTGHILLNHYNSLELAKKLISNGELSCIYEKCDKPDGHTFENRIDGYCVYYGRDRGETGTAATLCDFDGLVGYEYSYVFQDGEWYLISYDGETTSLLIDNF